MSLIRNLSRSSVVGNELKKKLAIISANISKGQNKPGVELGPKYIKQDRLYYNLKNLNYEPIDYAEISDATVAKEISYLKNKNFKSVAKSNQKLSEHISNAIRTGHIPVTLGGDHSLALGTVNGVAECNSRIGVIWIDAHADINLAETTPTGNIHGQPVSFLLKELSSHMPDVYAKDLDWLRPNLNARNLVYIGLRDLDDYETYIIKKLNILAYSMTDVQQLGIHEVIKRSINHLTTDGNLLPLHVSVDIDALDPWFAPSTGTTVLGGLTLSELMAIGNAVHETGMLRALDLVEVNPSLSANESECKRTVFSAINTILSFFGYNTIGTLCKTNKY